MSRKRLANVSVASLPVLWLVWSVGCVCEHRAPRETCSVPGCATGCAEPHNYIAHVSPEAGGYHPTCWQRWPQHWCECPPANWETPGNNEGDAPSPADDEEVPGQLDVGQYVDPSNIPPPPLY